MAECSWTRRMAALVPVFFALFLGLTSLQGLALAQEAPPSDEEPSGQPPADEDPSPASDGGEDPASDSDRGESTPSDGGEAPSGEGSPSNSGGGDSSTSSGDGGSAATRTSSAASTNGAGADSETLKNKLRRLAAADTTKASRRNDGEGVATANADGDLGKLVASGEALAGGGGGEEDRIKARPVSPPAPGTSRLALTGAGLTGPLGAAATLIALGLVLLCWDRVKRVLIQVAVCLPVF